MMKTEMNKDFVKAAPNISNVLIENDRVRVLETVFKPGDAAKMHHHPDHVVYILKGGRLRLTSDGKTDDLDLKAGAAQFFAATDHEAANIGNSVIDMIVVELKK
jgi:beta-alanine degradation protein BauB